MIVSRKYLETALNLEGVKDEEIADKLTFAGIEVEGFHRLASGTSLVIGEVIKCDKIEGSDHLSHTLVNIGNEVKEIVCGAPNVRVGLKVIVAQVGSVLPGLVIKKATIKGVNSEGMLCSLLELGVPKNLVSEHSLTGIEELGEDAVVGNTNVLSYLGLDDTMFELKPLANRSDLNALENFVRELAAVLNIKYKLPTYEQSEHFKTKLKLNVKSELVSTFSLCEIDNVQVGPSPKWLVLMLEKHGLRSVNNLVDIGNYVMLLTGRPVHFYDLSEVSNKTFNVVSDLATSFVALNDESYKVRVGDQLIVDENNNVLCLGGIMGAPKSSINEKSTNVALEVASFDQATIRQTVTALNLTSDASIRFSKGINHFNTHEVFALAHSLLLSLMPNVKISNIVSHVNSVKEKAKIIFDELYMNKLLGTNLSREVMVNTLARVEIKVSKNNEVEVPPYRNDVFGNADLGEEIIRLLGFNEMKVELPSFVTKAASLSAHQKARNDIRFFLRSNGLYETLTYTLESKSQSESFNLFANEEAYELVHPMTPVRQYLRRALLPSLLETLNYNTSRQNNNFGLFEFSEINTKTSSHEHLAVVLTGSEAQNGILKAKPYDFFDIKGYFVAIMEILNISPSRYSLSLIPSDVHGFHPYQSALVKVGNEIAGYFGLVHPAYASKFGFPKNTYLLELNFSALTNIKVSIPKFSEFAKFPTVTRDLAFVIDQNVTSENIMRLINKVAGKLLVDVAVFDVFQSESLGEDKKSMALRLSFSDTQKTLRDEDVSPLISKIIEALEKTYKASIRGKDGN